MAAVLCAPGPSQPQPRQRSSSLNVLFVQHVRKCSLIEGGEGEGRGWEAVLTVSFVSLTIQLVTFIFLLMYILAHDKQDLYFSL